MTKSFSKNQQLYPFADKTTDPKALKSDLESWFSDVTVENDELLENARDDIDDLPETGETSQSSVKTAAKAKFAS